MSTSHDYIVYLHERLLLTPAEIARRTGLSPTRVSDILTRHYRDRRAED